MAACGALYAAAGATRGCCSSSNVGLALNWLGDSLDGTLARYRRVERPRFGFYVDHLADAFGALLVLGGLALSGLMSPLVAAGVLVAYFLLAIETYLATYAIGRFKISWGPFGGTELRIVLASLNGRRPLPAPGVDPSARPRGWSSTSSAWAAPRRWRCSPSSPESAGPGRSPGSKVGPGGGGGTVSRRPRATGVEAEGASRGLVAR